MNLLEAVLIRPGCSDDRAYLISTWLESFKETSYFSKRIRPKIFFKKHRAVVERILANPETLILCLAYKDAPEVLLGYLVYAKPDDGPIIHFAFVKNEFCKQGLFRELLKQAEVDLAATDPILRFSHWTFCVNSFMTRYPHWIYDPYLAFQH